MMAVMMMMMVWLYTLPIYFTHGCWCTFK